MNTPAFVSGNNVVLKKMDFSLLLNLLYVKRVTQVPKQQIQKTPICCFAVK